jgi:hypothetical protein
MTVGVEEGYPERVAVGHDQTHSQQLCGSSFFLPDSCFFLSLSHNIYLSLLNDKKKEEEEMGEVVGKKEEMVEKKKWERLSARMKKW